MRVGERANIELVHHVATYCDACKRDVEDDEARVGNSRTVVSVSALYGEDYLPDEELEREQIDLCLDCFQNKMGPVLAAMGMPLRKVPSGFDSITGRERARK